jgi:hypothetical protein
VTTPEKFYFDEMHYVPAARQMLEPVLPSPLLNPMHPPLAKELMAVSTRVFGDVPLGWRYPSVLFGSLAIVAMYLCGLALFTVQGPAVASALIAFFNQMVFVQSRIAMLDIPALAFGLLAIAAFISGFRKRRPHVWFALAARGWPSVFRSPANGADCLPWRSVSSRRSDPPDAKLAVCRICAEARQQPALAVMGFRRNCLRRFCGDAADLGYVRGNVDGDLQPADDFSAPTLCLSD